MQKSKSYVVSDINVLEEQIHYEKKYLGLPLIRNYDGSFWSVCCYVFVCYSSYSSDPACYQISDGVVLYELLVDVARKDYFVLIYTVRTTKTGKYVVSAPQRVDSGANEGKTNETTALYSAITKMQASHRKMQKNKTESTSADTAIPRVKPMLLGLYKYQSRDTEKYITFPCFVQRKYDGLRCVAVIQSRKDSSVVSLQSRGQCEYTNLNHITDHIRTLIANQVIVIPEGRVFFFDGELYAHGLSLQKINSLIKNDYIDTRRIQLRVFDGGFLDQPEYFFAARYQYVYTLLGSSSLSSPLVLVPTLLAYDEAYVNQLMEQFVDEKYEGAVLRDLDGPYVFSVNNKRSNTTLKYKKRNDLDVRVVDFTCGQARDYDAVVFICYYQSSKLFNVVQNTTLAERKKQFDFLKKDPLVLEILKKVPFTIEYSELSDEGVPLQPRGIAFRYDLVDLPDHSLVYVIYTVF